MCIALTLVHFPASGLIAPIVGYVGDDNFHVSPLVDMNTPAGIDAAKPWPTGAIAMGGACTGEHAIGQKKIVCMEDKHGVPALHLMRPIKAAFDPQNLFNPGKVFAA